MGHVEGCEACAEVRKTCPDCHREVANEHDEGIHNTGECGCEESRSLCWRVYNADEHGELCLPLSIYDKDSPEQEDV